MSSKQQRENMMNQININSLPIYSHLGKNKPPNNANSTNYR